MTVPILLSIRNKATRLPGKSFVEVGGKPAVRWLLARLQTVGAGSQVVLCTSTHPSDAVFEAVAAETGITCFRGSEDDKLRRYRDAYQSGPPAESLADYVVIVDGDDLLCDPAQIRRIIRAMHEDHEIDFCIVDQLPLGATGFGVRVAALDQVVREKQEQDTEIWGSYFTEDDRYVSRLLVPDKSSLRRPDLRLTLDYPEDLEVVRSVTSRTGSRPDVPLEEIMAVFDRDPELAGVNRAAHRRYAANLERRQAEARGGDPVEVLRRRLATSTDRQEIDAALDAARAELA